MLRWRWTLVLNDRAKLASSAHGAQPSVRRHTERLLVPAREMALISKAARDSCVGDCVT